MKIAIITIAGISSRFNESIPEEYKKLKAIYYEGSSRDTLLYHLLLKCSFADKIVLVGGYKIDDLKEYCTSLELEYRNRITIIDNDHFEDLGSGYSLYLGLNEAFKHSPDEIIFVEGDLDIDGESFNSVIQSDKNVLTYTFEPIYASKAVVLYKNSDNHFRYAFNSSHGLLRIGEPFSCILNSGQMWKFDDIDILKHANDLFYEKEKAGTNLKIIQNYIDAYKGEFALIGLKRWTNCNTREDFYRILSYWEEEE